jgi:hypothetical protein
LRDLFNKDEDSFRRRGVLSVPVEEISKVDVTLRGQKYVLVAANSNRKRPAAADDKRAGRCPVGRTVWSLEGSPVEA